MKFFPNIFLQLSKKRRKDGRKEKKSEIQHEQQICNLGFVSEANVLL